MASPIRYFWKDGFISNSIYDYHTNSHKHHICVGSHCPFRLPLDMVTDEHPNTPGWQPLTDEILQSYTLEQELHEIKELSELKIEMVWYTSFRNNKSELLVGEAAQLCLHNQDPLRPLNFSTLITVHSQLVCFASDSSSSSVSSNVTSLDESFVAEGSATEGADENKDEVQDLIEELRARRAPRCTVPRVPMIAPFVPLPPSHKHIVFELKDALPLPTGDQLGFTWCGVHKLLEVAIRNAYSDTAQRCCVAIMNRKIQPKRNIWFGRTGICDLALHLGIIMAQDVRLHPHTAILCWIQMVSLFRSHTWNPDQIVKQFLINLTTDLALHRMRENIITAVYLAPTTDLKRTSLLDTEEGEKEEEGDLKRKKRKSKNKQEDTKTAANFSNRIRYMKKKIPDEAAMKATPLFELLTSKANALNKTYAQECATILGLFCRCLLPAIGDRFDITRRFAYVWYMRFLKNPSTNAMYSTVQSIRDAWNEKNRYFKPPEYKPYETITEIQPWNWLPMVISSIYHPSIIEEVMSSYSICNSIVLWFRNVHQQLIEANPERGLYLDMYTIVKDMIDCLWSKYTIKTAMTFIWPNFEETELIYQPVSKLYETLISNVSDKMTHIINTVAHNHLHERHLYQFPTSPYLDLELDETKLVQVYNKEIESKYEAYKSVWELSCGRPDSESRILQRADQPIVEDSPIASVCDQVFVELADHWFTRPVKIMIQKSMIKRFHKRHTEHIEVCKFLKLKKMKITEEDVEMEEEELEEVEEVSSDEETKRETLDETLNDTPESLESHENIEQKEEEKEDEDELYDPEHAEYENKNEEKMIDNDNDNEDEDGDIEMKEVSKEEKDEKEEKKNVTRPYVHISATEDQNTLIFTRQVNASTGETVSVRMDLKDICLLEDIYIHKNGLFNKKYKKQKSWSCCKGKELIRKLWDKWTCTKHPRPAFRLEEVVLITPESTDKPLYFLKDIADSLKEDAICLLFTVVWEYLTRLLEFIKKRKRSKEIEHRIDFSWFDAYRKVGLSENHLPITDRYFYIRVSCNNKGTRKELSIEHSKHSKITAGIIINQPQKTVTDGASTIMLSSVEPIHYKSISDNRSDLLIVMCPTTPPNTTTTTSVSVHKWFSQEALPFEALYKKDKFFHNFWLYQSMDTNQRSIVSFQERMKYEYTRTNRTVFPIPASVASSLQTSNTSTTAKILSQPSAVHWDKCFFSFSIETLEHISNMIIEYCQDDIEMIQNIACSLQRMVVDMMLIVDTMTQRVALRSKVGKQMVCQWKYARITTLLCCFGLLRYDQVLRVFIPNIFTTTQQLCRLASNLCEHIRYHIPNTHLITDNSVQWFMSNITETIFATHQKYEQKDILMQACMFLYQQIARAATDGQIYMDEYGSSDIKEGQIRTINLDRWSKRYVKRWWDERRMPIFIWRCDMAVLRTAKILALSLFQQSDSVFLSMTDNGGLEWIIREGIPQEHLLQCMTVLNIMMEYCRSSVSSSTFKLLTCLEELDMRRRVALAQSDTLSILACSSQPLDSNRSSDALRFVTNYIKSLKNYDNLLTKLNNWYKVMRHDLPGIASILPEQSFVTTSAVQHSQRLGLQIQLFHLNLATKLLPSVYKNTHWIDMHPELAQNVLKIATHELRKIDGVCSIQQVQEMLYTIAIHPDLNHKPTLILASKSCIVGKFIGTIMSDPILLNTLSFYVHEPSITCMFIKGREIPLADLIINPIDLITHYKVDLVLCTPERLVKKTFLSQSIKHMNRIAKKANKPKKKKTKKVVKKTSKTATKHDQINLDEIISRNVTKATDSDEEFDRDMKSSTGGDEPKTESHAAKCSVGVASHGLTGNRADSTNDIVLETHNSDDDDNVDVNNENNEDSDSNDDNDNDNDNDSDYDTEDEDMLDPLVPESVTTQLSASIMNIIIKRKSKFTNKPDTNDDDGPKKESEKQILHNTWRDVLGTINWNRIVITYKDNNANLAKQIVKWFHTYHQTAQHLWIMCDIKSVTSLAWHIVRLIPIFKLLRTKPCNTHDWNQESSLYSDYEWIKYLCPFELYTIDRYNKADSILDKQIEAVERSVPTVYQKFMNMTCIQQEQNQDKDQQTKATATININRINYVQTFHYKQDIEQDDEEKTTTDEKVAKIQQILKSLVYTTTTHDNDKIMTQAAKLGVDTSLSDWFCKYVQLSLTNSSHENICAFITISQPSWDLVHNKKDVVNFNYDINNEPSTGHTVHRLSATQIRSLVRSGMIQLKPSSVEKCLIYIRERLLLKSSGSRANMDETICMLLSAVCSEWFLNRFTIFAEYVATQEYMQSLHPNKRQILLNIRNQKLLISLNRHLCTFQHEWEPGPAYYKFLSNLSIGRLITTNEKTITICHTATVARRLFNQITETLIQSMITQDENGYVFAIRTSASDSIHIQIKNRLQELFDDDDFNAFIHNQFVENTSISNPSNSNINYITIVTLPYRSQTGCQFCIHLKKLLLLWNTATFLDNCIVTSSVLGLLPSKFFRNCILFDNYQMDDDIKRVLSVQTCDAYNYIFHV
jgi:hypothetical protein